MGDHDLVGDFNRVHRNSQSLSSAAGYRISGQTPSAPKPKTEGNVAGSSSNFMAGARRRSSTGGSRSASAPGKRGRGGPRGRWGGAAPPPWLAARPRRR